MKGIIFDMDGTMVDNMMVHHRAWQHQLSTLGLEMHIDEVKQKIHGVNTEILKRLFGDRFSQEEMIKISAEKEEAYRKIFLPDLKLIDGLAEFLEAAHAAELPMAIGSAAPPENVNFVLDNLDLRKYFKSIFHSKNVSKGKPHPEVYLSAAAGMNLNVKDCVVFEDSIVGAETAENAGCATVILTTTHEAEEFERFTNVRRFMKDFSGFSFAEMVEDFG